MGDVVLLLALASATLAHPAAGAQIDPTTFARQPCGGAQAGDFGCANTGGGILNGYFREDGIPTRSGTYMIQTGPASLRRFDGNLIQHFLADYSWTGRCVGGWCVTAVPPATPRPTPTPTPTRPRARARAPRPLASPTRRGS